MNSIKDGYTPVPPGKIASVVTSLEMKSKPQAIEVKTDPRVSLVKIEKPDCVWYQNLFRALGEEWLWFSRLQLTDSQLNEIILHPQVQIYSFRIENKEAGLLELDFRTPGECELAFFGLRPEFTGKGMGSWLMQQAIELAWNQPIQRFWVHTCTLDGPGALSFYIRAGFQPFQRQIEIADDPRLVGLFPRSAAPQVPIL